MQAYLGSMPWLALPYEKRQEREAAAQRFGIQGIPALVLLEGGNVINRNARGAVLKDSPAGAQFPWAGQEDASGGCAAHSLIACMQECLRSHRLH